MNSFVSAFVRMLLPAARGLYKVMLEFDRRTGNEFDVDRHQTRLRATARKHDMATDGDEQYYAEQYWRIIESSLDMLACDRAGTYLDLGCGQGRLVLPLARWCMSAGGRVQGVDLSEVAIEAAKGYCADAGIDNALFACGDIAQWLEGYSDSSVDGVVLTEVLFVIPHSEALLERVARVLKPGGVLILSQRSLHHLALLLALEENFESFTMLLNQRSGRLRGGDVWLTWNSADELRNLLSDRLSFLVHEIVGIGPCSGIPGDPHASAARPSKLTAGDRARLMELELDVGRRVPDSGRYILAIATKSRSAPRAHTMDHDIAPAR